MKRVILIAITAIMVLIAGLKAENKTKDSIVVKRIEIKKQGNEITSKDSILYSKLSGEQIMQLKEKEHEFELDRLRTTTPEEIPLNGFGIVMVTLIPFLFVIGVLLLINRQRNQESKRKYDLYLKSIEMGQSIPENFFDEPKKNPASNLKRGILWLAVGVAVTISFVIMNETDALFLGIVPAFVGLGYLLVHLLDKPKQTNE